MFFVLPRSLLRKSDNILNAGLRDIYVQTLTSTDLNRRDSYQNLSSISAHFLIKNDRTLACSYRSVSSTCLRC